ncbi:MAG TPA: hypothetical protein VK066_11845 [Chloroflexota bacterium]|nr:hypothetical protein [Chloroflexota bacterium]
MRGSAGRRGVRVGAALVVLLAAWLAQVACAQAEDWPARAPRASGRVGSLPGYQAAAPLGFRLIDTRVDEQVYRRADGAGEGLVWSAAFTSRWALSADQLDRWSAQAISLLADGLVAEVQLGAYERLDASDVGEQRVAYRYQLLAADGIPVGEARLVVFARGAEVGVSGTATTGATAPLDAIALARGLDSELAGTSMAARAS